MADLSDLSDEELEAIVSGAPRQSFGVDSSPEREAALHEATDEGGESMYPFWTMENVLRAVGAAGLAGGVGAGLSGLAGRRAATGAARELWAMKEAGLKPGLELARQAAPAAAHTGLPKWLVGALGTGIGGAGEYVRRKFFGDSQ